MDACPRKVLQINNSCDLIVGGPNMEKIYMTSRGQNSFFSMRELFPDFKQLLSYSFFGPVNQV